MPAMLASLNRLGLPGSTSLENRAMAVDLAATLMHWDRRAEREAPPAAKDKVGRCSD